MPKYYAHKYALVTGGSGEIGSAICRRLASDGLFVFVHSHQRKSQADQIVESITNSGGNAQAISFDVTDYQACSDILGSIADENPIQVIVHNAGTHCDAPLAGMSVQEWQQVVGVSLHGFFNVTRPLLMPMMRTRWGRVISISSIAGVMGNRGQTNYAAAKAGLHGASKSLAIELASRGITVNCIAPGIIATKMSNAAFDENHIKSIVPMKRAGTTDEVAALAGFLASEDAGYISGQVINVNGAMA